MKKSIDLFKALTLLMLACMGYGTACAADSIKCPGDKVWNVAVVQAGPYIDFRKVFRQTVLSLKDKGLMQADVKVSNTTKFDEREQWTDIVMSSKNSCLRFLSDSLYDAKLNSKKNKDNIKELKKRIEIQGDIDMVWAMGTAAGYGVARAGLSVPTLVMTASDPESSGITGKGEFSNIAMLHVQKEVDKERSGLTMFYKTFNFKKLGTLVDIRTETQQAQSLPVMKDMSKELGFELVVCEKDINGPDNALNYRNYAQCIKELAKDCDAVYLTVGNGIDPDNHYMQLKPLIDRKIPTFSQVGSSEVAQGALLAMAETDLVESGAFEAGVIERIMAGENPGSISQYYYSPLSLSINMYVARLINWKPPFELLIAVDEVFDNIEKK